MKISPQMAELLPNGIEHLEIHCVICTAVLPRGRRYRMTCPPSQRPCQKILTLYRRYSLQLTKCLACLHPATPVEREDYKAWRRHRGELRKEAWRPKKTLDNVKADLATPDIALCDAKRSENIQDIALKKEARKRSRFDDPDPVGGTGS